MHRTIALAVLALVVVAAPPAVAGRIFGDIKQDGKPVAAGLRVTVTAAAAEAAKPDAKGESAKPQPATVADSTTTDKFGSYKLNVKDEGKCTLTLVVDKQPLTLEVFSYKAATRYDLVLEKKDGKLALRRK